MPLIACPLKKLELLTEPKKVGWMEYRYTHDQKWLLISTDNIVLQITDIPFDVPIDLAYDQIPKMETICF